MKQNSSICTENLVIHVSEENIGTPKTNEVNVGHITALLTRNALETPTNYNMQTNPTKQNEIFPFTDESHSPNFRKRAYS